MGEEEQSNSVLFVRSAVLDAMTNPTLATQEDEIKLPDEEPAASLALLEFLHSNEASGRTLFTLLTQHSLGPVQV